ncbi:glutaredoxin [Bacteriovorax sp. PP10]|uniref:Glutaredoxin n=1 Tax=Bacteriovorax antarcticus TaxID=3088717 RepID=A0ABU5VWV2_9BACT|nr:glutaredoxin [Bacteriovorax sp. PP10]MEA9356828.1 glutaredoxin [Bacteriovorax sp. PP10]
MSAPKLDFYYFESCPYCQRVIKVIDKHKIKVNWMDIHKDSAHAKKLQADTGRTTVPCLYIDGEPMFESLDIMKWMESNLDNLDKA